MLDYAKKFIFVVKRFICDKYVQTCYKNTYGESNHGI